MKKAFTLLLAMLVLMTVAGAVPAVAETVTEIPMDAESNWVVNESRTWEDVWNAEETCVTLPAITTVVFSPVLTDKMESGNTYLLTMKYKGSARIVMRGAAEETITSITLDTAADWTYGEVEISVPDEIAAKCFELRTGTEGTPASYKDLRIQFLRKGAHKNLVKNGRFELGESGWTLSGATADTKEIENGTVSGASGNYLKLKGNQNTLAKQNVLIESGKGYKLSFRVRSDSATANLRVQIGDRDSSGGAYFGAYVNESAVLAKDTWCAYTIYYTAKTPMNENGIWLYLRGCNNGNTIYFDDVTLEEVNDSITYHKSEVSIPQSQQGTGWIYPLYRSISAEETEVTAGDVYAHFRLNSADATFMAVTCIYEHKGEAVKLYDIIIGTGAQAVAGQNVTATEPYFVTNKVTVPASTDEVTYSVKSFMWNSAAGLNPYVKAATLQ